MKGRIPASGRQLGWKSSLQPDKRQGVLSFAWGLQAGPSSLLCGSPCYVDRWIDGRFQLTAKPIGLQGRALCTNEPAQPALSHAKENRWDLGQAGQGVLPGDSKAFEANTEIRSPSEIRSFTQFHLPALG